jgi:hypothetical protein
MVAAGLRQNGFHRGATPQHLAVAETRISGVDDALEMGSERS